MKLEQIFQNKTFITMAVVLSALCVGCVPNINFSAEQKFKKTTTKYVETSSKQLKNSQLQTVLDEAVEDLDIPGVVMYISGPQGTWIGASGYSDLDSEILMKPDDKLALASASKTFVGVVILKLVEQGQLNLDESINNYLPKDISRKIRYSDEITVRQLLNHSSGIIDYLDDNFTEITEGRSRSQPWKAREVIKLIYGEPQAKPGKKHDYSNSNYILLELIVEETTGKSLAETMRDKILNPIGLENTFTELRERNNTSIVTGYSDINEDGVLKSHKALNEGNGLGDGGLISNAMDTAKFIDVLVAKKIYFLLKYSMKC
ncbi:beta-lactamase [Calothrix parasitica NIES-267]|uniref:Beta-lactamase n=1 Tax=Calothrix parasitica NIES-267 TaxID=1973488 RepID=A0A1Z4LSS0_9CYAN|nr:beta-lactamase [Calothrix parasitica NIES-267]